MLNTSSIHSLKVPEEELRDIWRRVKPIYEESVQELLASSDEDSKHDLETVRARYQTTYATYVDCMSRIGEAIAAKKVVETSFESNTTQSRNEHSSVHLPPCDTELFHGDYLSCPSFRDLFTAIYIRNSRLSPVEKLFHLNNKTRNEAREVVKKAPLTNEGFEIAWKALQLRYENKRLLINSQLKLLFGLQKISVESGDSIKSIQSTINGIISALKLYGIDVHSWDPIFVYLCCTRLPENTLSLWEQSVNNKSECPSWQELDKFLTGRYQTLETVSDLNINPSSCKSTDPPKSFPKVPKRVNAYQNKLTIPQCKLCPDQSHTIRLCPKFANMCYKDKMECIRKLKLCLNCFAKNHTVKECKSTFNCLKCHLRHHTLMCTTKGDSGNSSPPVSSEAGSSNSQQIQSTTSNATSVDCIQSLATTTSRKVLLGTAIVHILHRGEIFMARAVFDSGSEASFISEKIFNFLNLNANKISAHISGLNGSISARSQKICDICITSPINSEITINTSAIVLPHLTSSLPTFTANAEMFSQIPDIQLADPEFYRTSYVDILIGADLIPQVMLDGIKRQVCGSLMAQETIFGWVLTGPIQSDIIKSFRTTVSYLTEMNLDEQISKFFEVEDLPKRKYMSESDKFCEELFVRTTTRGPSGRYIVELPFKEGFGKSLKLGYSKHIATAQFLRTENRLLRTPEIKL
ncbi:uncharacterized protein LOC142230871 [Haematobia irritans]|uniref:uncharacterized protein LOC142230871 n=1 Tax=Haematobia irritans TaxID=7368 RepID=UPI003F4F985E